MGKQLDFVIVRMNQKAKAGFLSPLIDLLAHTIVFYCCSAITRLPTNSLCVF